MVYIHNRYPPLMKQLIIIFISTTLSSCMYLMGEPTEHKEFQEISECYVYEYQVNSESFANHTIETIDESEANECTKNRILGTHLLKYNDDYYINTGDNHPETIIKKIDQLNSKYKTDTTHLSSISIFKNKTVITTKRKSTKINNHWPGEYKEWQIIYLNPTDTFSVDSLSISKYHGWLK